MQNVLSLFYFTSRTEWKPWPVLSDYYEGYSKINLQLASNKKYFIIYKSYIHIYITFVHNHHPHTGTYYIVTQEFPYFHCKTLPPIYLPRVAPLMRSTMVLKRRVANQIVSRCLLPGFSPAVYRSGHTHDHSLFSEVRAFHVCRVLSSGSPVNGVISTTRHHLTVTDRGDRCPHPDSHGSVRRHPVIPDTITNVPNVSANSTTHITAGGRGSMFRRPLLGQK